MIRRLFIANRGEIAVRIVRACRELGIESVVGFSAVDRDGLACALADRAVCIGPAPAAASYLRVDAVLAAALGTGCDAIHPGYGFLSENAALAAGALESGLVFVGPPAEVIAFAGDKLAAREAAARAGITVAPGRGAASVAEAATVAEEAGYPVLLKAAGGGGGRGIKLAHDAREIEGLFALAAAEARSAFGDERVYVERYVAAARHVEVQIAADERAVIQLGERDCSVQRRFQKLVEESPAPGLGSAVRDALHAAAVAFARAIGYRNLGTVEFVLDAERDEFFFLEMNCRIQVEHPVSEAVCGLDLVCEQLRIASGEGLSLAQEAVSPRGHAIECRLTAEDPERGFAPSPGRVTRFELPELSGLRVDTHCHDGVVIGPFYDSLMAKLIAHGSDREHALEIMRAALAGTVVEGVRTNRELLARVLEQPQFAAGAVTTRWLEESFVLDGAPA